MKKHRKAKKLSREPDQDFAIFLKSVREQVDVSGDVLGEGVVDQGYLSKIEAGLRPAGKMLRNRLLGRMGVTTDMYENLLDNEDYAVWEWQQKILQAVHRKDFQTAEQLIEGCDIAGLEEEQIRNQFCLMMKAEIMRQQGADNAALGRCYGQAVRLTVPRVEEVYVEDKMLSVLEINTILEYEYYTGGNSALGEFAAKCRRLMKYVENPLYDELSKAKIYPKIVYYYLRVLMRRDNGISVEDRQEALRYCDRAIEVLRRTGRAFYLVEILEYRREFLTQVTGSLEGGGRVQEAETYKAVLQESMELEGLLKKLYAEYEVPEHMQDCTYLYWQRWVFPVGDALRIRRSMYGMTQEEVSAGICSVKSLRRAEKRQTNMQREPLGQVMRRLGLSKEIQKTNVVTSDREVLRLRTELAACQNNHEIVRARELLGQLKERVCLEIPENLQYIMECEASLDLMAGVITEAEYISREETALRCTLDITDVCGMDEVYMTETEMTCIRQQLQCSEPAEKRRKIDFLIRFFENIKKKHPLTDYIAMYEFVMKCITSELGNMGEYQLATGLDREVLKEVLECRRLGSVTDFLYDMLWNEKEQRARDGQQMEQEKMTDGLKACLAFSHFYRNIFKERFYSDKLHQSVLESSTGWSLQGETDSSPV